MSKIPESKKHNNFWIYKSGLNLIATSLPIKFNDGTKVIHAIKYSAYEQLQKQNQELIDALKFYADGLNYESVYEDDEMDLHIKIDREDVCFDEDDQYFGYAGDFARKTLAKFSKGEL